MDPIKDGLNWYQYCYSNPTTYWDLFGLKGDMVTGGGVPAVGKATEKAVERASQSKFNKMNCQTQKSSGIGLTAISEIKMLELWSNARKPSGIDIGSQISLLAEKMLRSIGASQKDIMNSLYGLSAKGFDFLIQYELGTDLSKYSYIRLDGNGNILSIRNQDVGDGGITVGFGIYVEASNINTINLLKTLGIDATDPTQWVSIGAATTAFNMISPHYEGVVNDFLSRHNISVTQAQYDALYMFGYNRQVFLQTNGAVDTMVSTNNTNINDWRIEVINEYKSLPQWPTYGNGWTNRTEDELELYFYNDYWRTH